MIDCQTPAPQSVAMTWHPWRHLRLMSGVDVRWSHHGDLGGWCATTRTMTFHTGQGQAQRRCTATHEIVHSELNHDGPCSETTELIVRRIAARRLITMADLASAVLFHGDDLDGLAEELWVDLDTLQTRLQHLHPAERGYLKRRLAMKEHTA